MCFLNTYIKQQTQKSSRQGCWPQKSGLFMHQNSHFQRKPKNNQNKSGNQDQINHVLCVCVCVCVAHTVCMAQDLSFFCMADPDIDLDLDGAGVGAGAAAARPNVSGAPVLFAVVASSAGMLATAMQKPNPFSHLNIQFSQDGSQCFVGFVEMKWNIVDGNG